MIATQAMGAIVSSFNGVLIGVSYYQLRVAKEGVDIDKIASVFIETALRPPQPAAPSLCSRCRPNNRSRSRNARSAV